MPSSQPIASELSFEILQKRLRSRELGTPDLDDRNRRLYGLPRQVVQREAFIASRETVHDGEAWDLRRLARRQERLAR